MNHPGANASSERNGERRRLSILAVLVVLAVYAVVVVICAWEPKASAPAWQPYNLQAEGFRAGQLNLAVSAPPGLAELADPYDPVANLPYRETRTDGFTLHDMSYRNGKIYQYFGATPVIVLFWPWLIISGGHFPQELAVLIFCSVGFIAGAWLYCRLARQFFPEAGAFVLAAGLLAFGLAGGLPPLLWRPQVYEVAVSCGNAFAMVALALVWQALDRKHRRAGWLAMASLCYGLAVAARPSLLYGAIILLAPVIANWRERAERDRWRRLRLMLPAAVLPIGLIGVGMMILNARRFGSPFEFGVPYLLTGINVHQSPPLITGRYIGYNLRVYFLEPVLWSMRSVFPIGIRLPTEPMPGYVGTENPFGILTSVPFVWLAGLAAFAGRGLAGEARLRLRWIIGCMLALHFCSLATVCAVAASCTRYEADFLPQLMLLASLGLLVLERMLVGHRMWRVVARCIWGLLLCYSSIVGALVGASANSVYVGMRDLHMLALATEGHSTEPLAWVETAARRYSDRAMPFIHRLGETYFQQNRLPEAAACFERLVQIEPSADYAHNFLGVIFYRQGRMEDARKHFLRALELNPDYRVAAENLAKLAPKSDPLPERR